MKTIKILGHEVKVKPTCAIDLENKYGDACCANNEIRLNDGLEKSTLEATMLHEILEYLRQACQLDDLEHKTLSTLSEGLYQVLVDNPDLFGGVG